MLSLKDVSSQTSEEVLKVLGSGDLGLNEFQVSTRHKQYGRNLVTVHEISLVSTFARQITTNPLLVILVISTTISFFLGQQSSSFYIFLILIASIILGFWNEYSAEKTVESLLSKISPTCIVLRNNSKFEIPVAELTPGDVVLLSQGSIVPADLRLIETKDLQVNESVLTGESGSITKNSSRHVSGVYGISELKCIAYMGTSVESGSAKGVVFNIGKDTEYGKIAKSSGFLKPTTEFQKGLEGFSKLIIKVVFILTFLIFLVNFFLGRPLVESSLFALAIAVGLTPELLPVIVTVSLSHGAGKLAKKHIVAKRLISLENLGNMDVLCSDKTGTLTEGKIEVVDYFDEYGKKNPDVLYMGLLCNSAVVHHKILGNPIDVSIWEYAQGSKLSIPDYYKKIYDEPFDYNRKEMYCVVQKNSEPLLIVKGAPESVIKHCSEYQSKHEIFKKYSLLSSQGLRVVAVASKLVAKKENYSWEDTVNLRFEGFISFSDVPRKTAKEALNHFKNLNVSLKIITGDNEIITRKICSEVGIDVQRILFGTDIDKLSEVQLAKEVEKVEVFARTDPEQKLKVIKALQKNGHTVGYLGDGINDLPALHNADVGISVNSAVDVAKGAASIVLLRKSLNVIADGIIEGRKTFNNTIKYILMSTSSNFGNMFSAAGASFFLSFLPMTPLQILLTNGLYDVSQMSIPSDNVDHESLVKPKHWNIGFIKNYMMFFGPLSSIYDFLTFGVMLFFFQAKDSLFQTGWFIESIATEILVVFIIRTSKTPFFLSRPGKWLLITCLSIVGVAVLLPFTPLSHSLGFTTPPPAYFAILILLVSTYLILVEVAKTAFLRKYKL